MTPRRSPHADHVARRHPRLSASKRRPGRLSIQTNVVKCDAPVSSAHSQRSGARRPCLFVQPRASIFSIAACCSARAEAKIGLARPDGGRARTAIPGSRAPFDVCWRRRASERPCIPNANRSHQPGRSVRSVAADQLRVRSDDRPRGYAYLLIPRRITVAGRAQSPRRDKNSATGQRVRLAALDLRFGGPHLLGGTSGHTTQLASRCT